MKRKRMLADAKSRDQGAKRRTKWKRRRTSIETEEQPPQTDENSVVDLVGHRSAPQLPDVYEVAPPPTTTKPREFRRHTPLQQPLAIDTRDRQDSPRKGRTLDAFFRPSGSINEKTNAAGLPTTTEPDTNVLVISDDSDAASTGQGERRRRKRHTKRLSTQTNTTSHGIGSASGAVGVAPPAACVPRVRKLTLRLGPPPSHVPEGRQEVGKENTIDGNALVAPVEWQNGSAVQTTVPEEQTLKHHQQIQSQSGQDSDPQGPAPGVDDDNTNSHDTTNVPWSKRLRQRRPPIPKSPCASPGASLRKRTGKRSASTEPKVKEGQAEQNTVTSETREDSDDSPASQEVLAVTGTLPCLSKHCFVNVFICICTKRERCFLCRRKIKCVSSNGVTKHCCEPLFVGIAKLIGNGAKAELFTPSCFRAHYLPPTLHLIRPNLTHSRCLRVKNHHYRRLSP